MVGYSKVEWNNVHLTLVVDRIRRLWLFHTLRILFQPCRDKAKSFSFFRIRSWVLSSFRRPARKTVLTWTSRHLESTNIQVENVENARKILRYELQGHEVCRCARHNVSECIIVIPSWKLISCNQSIAIVGNLSCL